MPALVPTDFSGQNAVDGYGPGFSASAERSIRGLRSSRRPA